MLRENSVLKTGLAQGVALAVTRVDAIPASQPEPGPDRFREQKAARSGEFGLPRQVAGNKQPLHMLSMRRLQVDDVREVRELCEAAKVDNVLRGSRRLDIVVSRVLPVGRMRNRSCAHHVQGDSGKTAIKMLSCLHRNSVVETFPVRPAPPFTTIELLGSTAPRELHETGDRPVSGRVVHQQVLVIRGDDVVEHAHTVALAGDSQPVAPVAAVVRPAKE